MDTAVPLSATHDPALAGTLAARDRPAAAVVLNAMTVDVEEHFQVSAFEGVIDRRHWDDHPSRVGASTERVLDLLDRAGVRATFFVLGWVAERQAELVRRIAAAGHEIASHGYSHRLIYTQRPDEFREELARSRRVLEDLTGLAVIGHRAASFSIGRGNLWALDVVAECGFTYDSSLFPVVHDRYGVPGAPGGPYRLSTPAGGVLDELPPSTMACGPLTLPVAGGGYLRLYPAALTSWAIARLNRREGRPAVVYVHPWEFDPAQPRVRSAGWLSRFRHYVNLHRTEDKLLAVLAGHRFAPAREVLAAGGPLPSARIEHGHIRLGAG